MKGQVEIKETGEAWAEVLEEIDKGTFWDKFSAGNILPFDLGPEGDVQAYIAPSGGDELADGNGYADVTFLTRFNTMSYWPMNQRWAREWNGEWLKGTGAVGGWKESEMRLDTMPRRIMPLIEQYHPEVAERIVAVKKYTESKGTDGKPIHNEMTVDKLWVPSKREIFGGKGAETMGADYTALFDSPKMRKRYKPGYSSPDYAFLRSVYPNSVYGFAAVNLGGYAYYYYANSSRGLWFGFSIHRK